MVRAKLNLWNHWFWITLVSGSVLFDQGRGDGTASEREPNVLQDFNETEPKVVISKSVSVSKVSVKMGDVRIARKYEELDDRNDNFIDHHPPVLNPRASQPVDTVINHFIEQLRYFASVGDADQTEDNLDDDDENIYYSDYVHPSDDYLNYLYEMYNSIGDDYYDETDLNDIVGDNANNLDTDFRRSDEDSSGRSEDLEEEFTEELFENGSVTAVHLVTQEPLTPNKDTLDFVDKFFNASKQDVDKDGITMEDFVVELKSTNNNSDGFIKIGIFITVTIAVLLMTGGLVFVMMKRKTKTVMETNLVTNDQQFVFQSRGMKGLTTNSIQENFNNHFGKTSAYLYDDLHSLDNDSFLTSLETISEKEKFNWE